LRKRKGLGLLWSNLVCWLLQPNLRGVQLWAKGLHGHSTIKRVLCKCKGLGLLRTGLVCWQLRSNLWRLFQRLRRQLGNRWNHRDGWNHRDRWDHRDRWKLDCGWYFSNRRHFEFILNTGSGCLRERWMQPQCFLHVHE